MSQFIGNVSAYAYAQTQGYTGTEEEFAELMASYATVAEAAEASAQSAASSASAASGSASTANTAAQTAATKASEAAQSATGASQSATQAESAKSSAQASAQTATTKASEASQSATNAAGSATTANEAADDATAAKTAAETAKTAAQQSATSAATSAQTAQDVLESIPEDYSDLSESVEDLKLFNSNIETIPHYSTNFNISEILDFEKTNCIFHDNFHRANDASDIGQNGTADYPMTYIDISQNVSETGNMQIGISNNKAVGFNAYNVTDTRRRIKAVDVGTLPYKVSVSFADSAWIAVGIVDINNYIFINASKMSVGVAPLGTVVCDNVNVTHNANINCVDVYVYADKISIYVGGKKVIDCSATVSSAKCGMVFRAGSISTLIYETFDVYVPAKFIDIGYSKTIEKSAVVNSNRLLGALQLPNTTYSCTFDTTTTRYSDKSLKFDLKYGDTYGDSVRAEIMPPVERSPLYGLQAGLFEFDAYFPSQYFGADNKEDCVFQLHHTDDGVNYAGASPNIMLYVLNDHLYLNVVGASAKIMTANEATTVTYDLGTLDKDTWHRYSIYYKQGYMSAHNPVTALYVDGELKVLSRALNMYNTPYSSYPKFGIYKWSWKSAPSMVTERVVYFANVNVWQ